MRYRFIGDTILTVPFLRNLRKAYPQAVIDVLVGPESGTVLAGCPYINELISFDTTRFHKYDRGRGKPRNFMAYAVDLRKRSYDQVFVLKRSWSSGLLSWLTGARVRVGYDTEGRRMFLTHPVPWDEKKHEVESVLDVLRAAGIAVTDNYLEAWVSKEEDEQLVAMVPELTRDRKVLIHAAAAHPDKMYPLDLWVPIIRGLHGEFGILPFFTGAERDRELYAELEKLSGVKGVNLSGQLSLRQSLALYKHMELAVCVDSGPAHMAAAVDTPTVALFGPSDPDRWRPWGTDHVAVFDPSSADRPCERHKDCHVSRCLSKLNPQMVLSECQAILARRAAHV
jgi:heptosyltransferase-2